jgi:hypothetical protein
VDFLIWFFVGIKLRLVTQAIGVCGHQKTRPENCEPDRDENGKNY